MCLPVALQLHADKDDHISRLQDQAAAREAQLQAEVEALSAEMTGRIDGLQAELDSLLAFKQQKASRLVTHAMGEHKHPGQHATASPQSD